MGLGGGVEWGESAAYTGSAEFGVQLSDGFGDLLAGEFVTLCLAVGVGGVEISSGGHECLVVLAGGGPGDVWFGVEVPALAALGHP
jgi:hypothetical protein